MSCAEFVDQAAELALGTLEGEYRALALIHADSCPSCRALLQDLSLTTDALLQLAPSAEPPIGFESRLFASIHDVDRTPRRHWWRPAAMVTVAAAVAIGLGFGAGEVVSSGGAPQTAIANLIVGGGPRGQVVVAPGHPARVFVSVHDLAGVGTVGCQVTLANGRTVLLGTWDLQRGYGGWTVPLSIPPDQLRSAQLVRMDGTTLASAKFTR